MKSLLLCLVLAGAALAMPIAEEAGVAPVVPETEGSEIPQADAKPSPVADKPAETLVPTATNAVPDPEVKSDAVPSIKTASPEAEASKPETVESKPVETKPEPAVEKKAPEDTPQLKSGPVSEDKLETVPQVKPEAVAQVQAESIPETKSENVEVKRETVPELKTEVPAEKPIESKPEEKSEKEATVVELSKEQAKTVTEKPVDIVKAANEMPGIADDSIDRASLIPQPEKKIDLPVIAGKSAESVPILEQVKTVTLSDNKEAQTISTPAVTVAETSVPKEEKTAAEPKAASAESAKSVPVPSSDITPPVLVAPKPAEDSLRVVRDTVDDKVKKFEKPVVEEKSVKAAETKIVEGEEKANETPKIEEPAKVGASLKAVEPVKAEEPAKSEEPTKAEKPTKAEEPAKSVEAVKSDKSVKSDVAKSEEPAKAPEPPKAEASQEPPKAQASKEPSSQESSESSENNSSEESSEKEDKKGAPAPKPIA